MNKTSSFVRAVCIGSPIWVALFVGACDSPEDDSSSSTSDCDAISNVCHGAEALAPGSTEAAACHDLSHDGPESECAAQKAACISLCEAIIADGGGGASGSAGQGGSSDSGLAGASGASGSSGAAGAAGADAGSDAAPCLESGDSCTDSAECCSNECHGDPLHCH